MTRINCHSAFKHYEMFHSGCHGGGNYGSIFNTTYNIDCGGHGGFGAALEPAQVMPLAIYSAAGLAAA